MSTVSSNRAPGAKAPQRILALWLSYLATDRLQREAGGPAWRGARRSGDAPITVVAKINNALRLAAIDEVAAARGLRVGQALADARGAVPDLAVHEEDGRADAALLEAIAGWCERYTPLVALDPPDGLYLDITGCAHLFAPAPLFTPTPLFTPDGKHDEDGEARLAADLRARLTAQGFAVRTAIAASPGAAWAVCRYGEARHGKAVQRIAPGAERQALAGLPVAGLRLGAGPLALLGRLGLKRIGQLIGQPRAPLAARFGRVLVTRLDQALGHEDEPLSPRLPVPALTAERRFAEPVFDTGSIGAAVRSLAGALQPALTRRGEGARALQLVLFASDGKVTRLNVGTAAPLRDAGLIAALFAERLAAAGPGETDFGADFGAGHGAAAGFDMVRLCVTESEPLAEVQIDLAGEAGGAADRNQLFSRLGARLGEARVTRPAAIDSHIPEQAVLARPVASHSAQSGGVGAGSEVPFPDPFPGPFPGHPPERPLKLFERPEPVEVIAEVPDGPPLAFRWRRVLYQVARAEGPERIAPEWWRGDRPGQNLAAATRDYFRIEDQEGRRFWLYRDGLYGGEADPGVDHDAGRPSWYVHGLFA